MSGINFPAGVGWTALYFPKGTDLARHSREHLDAVAA
jgi:hypothetical protein